MKLLFSIILTTSLFAQDKSNQNSYAIETSSQYYKDASIDSVYGLWVKLYDRRLNTTLNIPIAEIKTLRQNGWRQKWKPNMLVKAIGTAAGGAVGCVSGIFVGCGDDGDYDSYSYDSYALDEYGYGDCQASDDTYYLGPDDILTPGKFMFEVPSNDTPPIVLAVCN